MRVLLVEDSQILLRTVRRALRHAGFAVDTAADGEEGLAAAALNDYDVVVLDIMLPKLGKKYKHPIQEAAQAEQRLTERARSAFDEFQILCFRATNARPFSFEWVDLSTTEMEYSSVLTRVSREYDGRF